MFHEKGESLIEVIVAATVGIMVVAALTFAVIFSLRNANFAKNSTQATKLAQEGIETVRTGRDRTADMPGGNITGGFEINNQPITSWDSPALWANRITGSTDCPIECYFKIISTGELQYIGPTMTTAELIDPGFKRVVTLSDDPAASDYTSQKKVTVIVTWDDFAGVHESRLTTILRKL